MTPNVELAIRLVVFLVMIGVGLDLHPRDFLRLREHPRPILGVVTGQWILLVLIAGVLGRFLALPDEARAGVLLMAAAPAAPLSCFYAQLAGGQLALATTLTAVSTVLAAFATPLAAEIGFDAFLDSRPNFEIAAGALVQHTLAGLVLPLLVGMLVARRFADRVERWRRSIRTIGIFASSCLLAVIVVGEFAAIKAHLADFVLGSATFTLAMLMVGFLVARIAVSGGSYRRAVPWGFPARNVAVALLIGIDVEAKADVIAFIAVLFVTQVASLVAIALWLRTRAPTQIGSLDNVA